MLPSVLVVDDEQEILVALERLLGRDYRVFSFTSPREALVFYQHSPTHIVISDLRMPAIDGGEFLKEIVALNPRSKRIALTGYADIDLAKKAFNEGRISYYIDKPWDNDEFKVKLSVLIDELKQENRTHNLINKLQVSNKALLIEHRSDVLSQEILQTQQNDLQSMMSQLRSVNNELVLISVNLIALNSNEPLGHSVRIAQQAKVIAQRMGCSEIDCLNIYLAGLFHRVGISTLSETLRAKAWYQLDINEQQRYNAYIDSSVKIMSSSSFLTQSTAIVKLMSPSRLKQFSESEENKSNTFLGAKILYTLISFDLLINGQLTGYSVSPDVALTTLANTVRGIDSKIIKLLASMFIESGPDEVFEYPILTHNLEANMVLAQDIIDRNEHKVLAMETILTQSQVAQLNTLQKNSKQPILIYVRSKMSECK